MLGVQQRLVEARSGPEIELSEVMATVQGTCPRSPDRREAPGVQEGRKGEAWGQAIGEGSRASAGMHQQGFPLWGNWGKELGLESCLPKYVRFTSRCLKYMGKCKVKRCQSQCSEALGQSQESLTFIDILLKPHSLKFINKI